MKHVKVPEHHFAVARLELGASVLLSARLAEQPQDRRGILADQSSSPKAPQSAWQSTYATIPSPHRLWPQIFVRKADHEKGMSAGYGRQPMKAPGTVFSYQGLPRNLFKGYLLPSGFDY